jgi:hypothetical protein
LLYKTDFDDTIISIRNDARFGQSDLVQGKRFVADLRTEVFDATMRRIAPEAGRAPQGARGFLFGSTSVDVRRVNFSKQIVRIAHRGPPRPRYVLRRMDYEY